MSIVVVVVVAYPHTYTKRTSPCGCVLSLSRTNTHTHSYTYVRSDGAGMGHGKADGVGGCGGGDDKTHTGRTQDDESTTRTNSLTSRGGCLWFCWGVFERVDERKAITKVEGGHTHARAPSCGGCLLRGIVRTGSF